MSSPRAVVILVVDDRPTASAAAMRAGIGAAMRRLGAEAVAEAAGLAPDWAAWHPIDVAVAIVPASNVSLEAVVSPVNDPRLAWTTNEATPQSADAVAVAVEEHVQNLASQPGSPFQPLARARAIVDLITRTHPPEQHVEQALHAVLAPRAKRIAVAIVATTDDESPGPTRSYRLPPEIATIGLATSERDPLGEADPIIYPRLLDWSDEMLHVAFSGCVEDPASPPFFLFESRCRNHARLWCPSHSIAEITPGLGRCIIRITTPEPVMCDASRGWIDPLAGNGSRRPRFTNEGERICEVMPVDPGVMNTCIHDDKCENCGSGWCVSEVLPLATFCPAGSTPLPIRWIGGALPQPGTVQITCLSPDDSTAR